MKKLINRPEDVVEEMLQGFSVLHPGSVRLLEHKAMLRDNAEQVREQQVTNLIHLASDLCREKVVTY